MPVNQQDLDAFVNEAVAHIKKQGPTKQSFKAMNITAGPAGVDFCTLWPGIREGLTVLKEFLPVWARWMVAALIAIGDGVCGR